MLVYGSILESQKEIVKSNVDEIHEYLLLKGVDVCSIHGDKDQYSRIKAIREEQKKDKDLDKDELKKEKPEKNKTTKHKQPKSKKKKSKERG